MNNSLALFCVPVLLLVGCKKEESGQAPAMTQEAKETMKAAEAARPATPPAPTAGPVDVCALLSRADAEAVMGPLADEPTRDQAQGSMLGGCNFASPQGASASISARPAREYQGTVDYATRREPGTTVEGVGTEAIFIPKTGMFVRFADQPYFVHILASKTPGTWDKDLSVELAKKLKP